MATSCVSSSHSACSDPSSASRIPRGFRGRRRPWTEWGTYPTGIGRAFHLKGPSGHHLHGDLRPTTSFEGVQLLKFMANLLDSEQNEILKYLMEGSGIPFVRRRVGTPRSQCPKAAFLASQKMPKAAPSKDSRCLP